ncbi:glycosyltransferase family 4 protein [Aquamicrobium segne]|uniref:Glycosyltransferase family 4 protein n=1 Tax=Aquamicrobium segne TaxID=469547 RepID=A0ABW0H073_9HYPH
MTAPVDLSRVHVVVPNFKKRLSGVTSTIIQLVPLQEKQIGIATLGPGLPDHLPKLRWWQVPGLLRRPKTAMVRVWHARRNPEMLAGVILRDIFRAPLKLVFTSASQRQHTGWTKFLIRRMDAVIATSVKTSAYLKVPNSVVMHGIDTDRFCPPVDRAEAARQLGLDPGQLYVGCFGRVRHQKGTDLFVDAMITLLPDHPRWSAIVAGRATAEHKDFEAQLRDRVKKAGLAERILFVGEHKDIERWYQPLSLFIAPQRWEGFGLTPLEAMATGVPVIATDVGAFSELIEENVTGALIVRNDLEAMIAAAKHWMGNEVALEKAGKAALDHVHTHFQLAGEARQLGDIYHEFLGGETEDNAI